MVDYDSSWKEILEGLFSEFLSFCFPDIYKSINWQVAPVFLETELHELSPFAKTGRKHVDKLVRVELLNGTAEIILIHVEVQSQYDADLPRRMFTYYTRLMDRFQEDVVSIVILGDASPDWRPDRFEFNRLGCNCSFVYNLVKLIDFTDDRFLEESKNPFAAVVQIHLKSLLTKNSEDLRKHWKFVIVKGLYYKGWSTDVVRRVLSFLDWVLLLPQELNVSFWEKIIEYESEDKMPLLSYIEQVALEKGESKGKSEGYEQGKTEGESEGYEKGKTEATLEAMEMLLEMKFGQSALPLMTAIRAQATLPQLVEWLHALKTITAFEDFEKLVKQK